MTEDNQKLWPSFLTSLTLKEKKICQFDCPAIHTLHIVHSWLTEAHHTIPQRWVLFSFPVMIRAPLLHTLLPSGEWRQMLQWIKAIWFASPPFSLAYNCSRTGSHTRNNRHSVNSWKGTAGFRWSTACVFLSAYRRIKASGTGSATDYTVRCMFLWQVWVINSVSTGVAAQIASI